MLTLNCVNPVNPLLLAESTQNHISLKDLNKSKIKRLYQIQPLNIVLSTKSFLVYRIIIIPTRVPAVKGITIINV
jgi:hypothetical protein